MQSWFWLSLAASVLWGLSYVIDQYLLKIFSYKEILVSQALISFLCLTPFVYFNARTTDIIHRFANLKHLSILIAAGFIYLIANILILKGVRSGNASLVAIIEASYPIFTLAFAYILLHEKQFNTTSIIGCLIILVGLIILKLGSPNA